MPELKTEEEAQELKDRLNRLTPERFVPIALPDEQRPGSMQVEITIRGRRPSPAVWRVLANLDWTLRMDACGTRTGEEGTHSTLVAVAPGGGV